MSPFRLFLSLLPTLYIAFSAMAAVAAGPTKVQERAASDLNFETISAKDAGLRYGQAAGVALVCYGLQVTPRVNELKAKFQGDELATFEAQTESVVAAWRSTLKCEQAAGPNECKLSHTWSCRQALIEIGPNGTALPGLVEQRVP